MLLLLSDPAVAIDIFVPSGQPTIQAGVDAANAGDRVIVAAGSYPETVTIAKVITVQGDGSGSTTITSSGSLLPTVAITADATLQGFRLINSGTYRALDIDGPGVTATLSDLYFPTQAANVAGGALGTDQATVIADSLVFDMVTTSNSSGAIGLSDTDFTLVDAIIDNGSALSGGAIGQNAGSSLTISTSTIQGNTATLGDGGGIGSSGGAVVATEVSFLGNDTAAQGGGLACDLGTCMITDGSFEGNGSATGGGGIATSGAVVTIQGTLFDSNDGGAEQGGGIWADGGNVDVLLGDFTDNLSTKEGAAIYLEGGVHTVQLTAFTNNATSGTFSGGGAITIENGASLDSSANTYDSNSSVFVGGALHIFDGPVTSTGDTFSSNYTSGIIASAGGAIRHNASDDLTIINGTFQGNTSRVGGAIEFNPSGTSTLNVSGTVFQSNDATAARGGAVYIPDINIGAVAIFDDNTFNENTANAEGGAIYAEDAETIAVRRNWFCGNSAIGDGGGLHFDNLANVTKILNNAFIQNSSNGFGGAASTTNGDYEHVNNVFLTNTAGIAGAGAAHADGDLLVQLNVFGWNNPDALNATWASSPTLFDHANLFWQNQGANLTGDLNNGDLDPSSLFAHPGFVAYTANGDCTDDDLNPDLASPLIDVSTTYTDLDGTDADIGIYGGPNAPPIGPFDNDNDTFFDDVDCDDFNDQVFPGQTEACNGIDDNCDTQIDEGIPTSDWFHDFDGDGYGDPGDVFVDCKQPSDYVANDEDCDDGKIGVNPDADEICNGEDDDCSGAVDDDATDALTFWTDFDEDGFGDPTASLLACDQPSGTADNDEDCDDTDSEINPDTYWHPDFDGDGFGAASSIQVCDAPSGYVLDDTDCDDDNDTVNPGAVELCDGLDTDCNGSGRPTRATATATASSPATTATTPTTPSRVQRPSTRTSTPTASAIRWPTWRPASSHRAP